MPADFIPELGFVQVNSDPICDSANPECQTAHGKAQKTHPIDYFVPNFGVDGDVRETKRSLANAEKALGHKFQQNFVAPKKEKPYTVPDFGLDEDVVNTQAHIAAQEKVHGAWHPV